MAQPQALRLVVLDGTWRKSRKMLYRNPGLQQLPRLALQDLPPGRYAIRKAQAPDQLSSFEAAARKLQFDLYYIKNMSFLLDASILLRTFKTILVGLRHEDDSFLPTEDKLEDLLAADEKPVGESQTNGGNP